MDQSDDTSTFSPNEARTLAALLDEVIPPSGDGRLPGAGELGIGGYIEEALQGAPLSRAVLAEGLALIGELANQRNPGGFAALSSPEGLELLNEVTSRQPGFLPNVIFHTYAGYYRNGRVMEALGLEPRPPHPKGYEVEPDDLTLLEQVRQRPKLYREV